MSGNLKGALTLLVAAAGFSFMVMLVKVVGERLDVRRIGQTQADHDADGTVEIFAHAIKTLERGKLVGVPTAGGVISAGRNRILDAGTTEDGAPYFVMELVKGIPITEFCDQNKLSIRERLELFIRLLLLSVKQILNELSLTHQSHI